MEFIHANTYIFIQENPFENVIWKIAAILSQPQCVNLILAWPICWQLIVLNHHFVIFIPPSCVRLLIQVRGSMDIKGGGGGYIYGLQEQNSKNTSCYLCIEYIIAFQNTFLEMYNWYQCDIVWAKWVHELICIIACYDLIYYSWKMFSLVNHWHYPGDHSAHCVINLIANNDSRMRWLLSFN